ncbi:hypothetical protein [Solimonas sp. SE-A11]|uniref:hypothetical protein n=1 Tax=Solimonas sp. SE-A11 TaxID=3054954 RepID=UPI00259C906F|nr:hypothetical protein [Solimonas sp. SE-A11]MDM4768935.1 hypothetical protein [Solimonas sp. SE-A11]
MSSNRLTNHVVWIASLLLVAGNAAARDSEWYFKVSNDTGSRITALQVSIDRQAWGDFDIGRGIKAGATETLTWDASTDDEPCEQWIRAKFADGSVSPPSKQDFCQDLDDPIVFSE